MEMDQGGSSTMWVAGQPNNGVVNNSNAPNPPPTNPRNIYDALFITFSTTTAATSLPSSRS